MQLCLLSYFEPNFKLPVNNSSGDTVWEIVGNSFAVDWAALKASK